MAKWRSLTLFQRILLAALAAMLVVFTALYPFLIGREGIEYQDTLLLWSAQGEDNVYTGKVDSETAVFTVSPGGVIQYQYGDTLYGPYTVTLDPTAVPRDHDMSRVLTGVEVRRGDELLFRGGWMGSIYPILVDENGEADSPFSRSYSAGGVTYGPDGQPLVPSHEPAVSSLLRLTLEPTLTHRGVLSLYFMAVLLTILGIVAILFADQLFRWNLSFIIRDPERAEPAEWELFGRYASWLICTGGALIAYLVGAFAIA